VARRQTIQDIFMKLVVFNMSMVKNIEYVIKKLNDVIAFLLLLPRKSKDFFLQNASFSQTQITRGTPFD
jgi:hypothetical protein